MSAQDSGRSGIEARVYAEQVALLYSMTPFSLRMAVLFSIMVVVAIAPALPAYKLAVWFISVNLVSAVRYLAIRRYHRLRPPAEAAPQWARSFILLTVAAGTLWGLMGTWLFPEGDPANQAMMLLFLMAVASVALFTLGSRATAYAALCVPILLPPAVNLFLIGGHTNGVLAVGLLLFTFIALSNARRHQENGAELLRLRFANARIAEERERALQSAEHASAVKSQFLANMSHEIRTPLNGILGMAQLLSGSRLDEEQKFRLDVVQRSGDHLLVLINDILDFSKIEAGRLAIECAPFELRRAVSDVGDLLAAIAHDKRIAFEVIVDPAVPNWVDGDSSRVKQVLNNLLGNAIKFTDAGHVRLSVRTGGAPGEGLLRFEVQDTGIGIPQQDSARIFDAFRQADSSWVRRHGGTGLGLTISRELARAMGGDIGYSSDPARGSTFWFTARLPEAAEPQGLPDAAEEQSPPGAVLSGRVLVAEDNPVNAMVAKAYLEKFGLTVDCAENGREALEHSASHAYDLILMDCQMPEMDGFEATRRIRARERASGAEPVAVVALTANAIRGDRERCLEAGMDDYLAKPFRSAELRAIVERRLRRATGMR